MAVYILLWCPIRAHVTRETCRETKATSVATKPEGKQKNASRAGARARHPRRFRLARVASHLPADLPDLLLPD